jgi:tRNA (guanine-N7-)-methyltransferase
LETTKMLPNSGLMRPAFAKLIADRREAVGAQLARILQPGASLVWEVGCGHGHFLTAYAAAHPQQLCIGVDIERDRIARAGKKRDRARLTNLHFLHSEARLFLEALPADAHVSHAFVLFPDPWPKLRHRKHRLMQPAFLTELSRHASADCVIYFRTDYFPYFEEVATAVRISPEWQLVDEPWPFEHQTVFQARAPQHHSLVARRRRASH